MYHNLIIQNKSEVAEYKCPHPGCTKSYSRKYRVKEHEKSSHGAVTIDECSKNISCPFAECGVEPFRTNKELLSHCENVHHENLGKVNLSYLTTPNNTKQYKGMKTLTFSSMRDFLFWKEREEEATYSTYVKGQQKYHPSSNGTHNLIGQIDMVLDEQLTGFLILFQRSALAITSPAVALANT